MDIEFIEHKNTANSFPVLGIRVDNLKKDKIIRKIERFLAEQQFHQIATVNAEFILEAQKNPKFKNILNNCDLNVADSISLKFAFWRFGKHLKARMAGADLVLEILRLAEKNNRSVFLACRKDGLSTFFEIKSTLLKIYPNLKIEGTDIDTKNIPYYILNTGYDILLCNFGAPHQELFLNSQKNDSPPHLYKNNTEKIINNDLDRKKYSFSGLQNNRCGGKIRLAMGVGGSFDFLTGKLKRAPRRMRKIGLEWLWRFIQEPRYRAKRIWKALVVFPLKVILCKEK